jgi:hypothetical protein
VGGSEADVMVVLGDGLTGLRGLHKGSVALVLSDLPSGETRAKFDTPPSMPELWEAVWHALADNGTAVFMASHIKFATDLIASQSANFKYDLVWFKTRAGGFLNAKHRPLRVHEFLLVFSRGRGVYHRIVRRGKLFLWAPERGTRAADGSAIEFQAAAP